MFIILGCAFTFPSKSNYNANSWSIYLDEQVILASWKKNKMGDLKSIDSKKYTSAKWLKVNRYLCGQSIERTTSIITIKTEDEQTVLKSSKTTESKGFSGEMNMSELFVAPLFKKGVPLKVYFTILNQEGEIIQTYLMGKVLFKA
jgi:hypothetical protein